MKGRCFMIILALTMCYFMGFTADQQAQSLKEIYKTGKVKFIEELRISNDKLPAEAPLKFFGDLFEDRNGNVFILDTDSNHILKFDANGKLIKTIGQKGQGPGDFYLPQCMTHEGQHILVYEFGNKRFSLFDFNGNFIKVIESNGVERKGLITKIGYLPNGDIVMGYKRGSRENRSLQEMFLEIYSKDFRFKKTLYSGNFCMFKVLGRTKIHQPYFRQLFWDMGQDGRVAFGFSEKFEIKIFDPRTNKTKVIHHDYKPIKITKEEKEDYLEQFSYDGGRYGQVPDYVKEYTVFPKYKPAFNNIIFDGQNNILVFPEDKSSYFYAFDPSGEFLERVEILPGNVNTDRIIPVNNNYFWFHKIDKNYGLCLIKCKVQGFI